MLAYQQAGALRGNRQVTSMARSASGLLLLAGALAIGGCVSRADYEKVRRDQQEMRAMMADTQVQVDKLSRRLDTVNSDVRDRGGGAETKELERRLSRLEARIAVVEAGGAQPVPPDTAIQTAPSTTTGVAPAGPPAPRTEAAVIQMRREDSRLAGGGVNEAYKRALDLYRQGKATEAIEQFRQFVRGAGAGSDLADDAQYWIGESYYHVQDFNRAIIELNEVLLKYPKGDRVPTALLALATAFADSGDKIDARLLLQKLVSDHPQSEETSIGRKKLEELTE
jgi:tol-pal system protein YbgF